MTTHLTLLCCAATATARTGGFPAPDEPLDQGGTDKAHRRTLTRRPAIVVRSPARAAAETADAMGLQAVAEPRLADMDFGDWTGRAFDALPGEALAHWLAAPDAGAPGGETPEQLRRRIAPWLAEQTETGRAVLAITHPSVIRAILAEALALPDRATMRIDIAPLSETILSHHGVWRLQQLRAD